jgi:hypothetical protein
MIVALLARPGAVSAEGITLTHRTPVLQLCRALIAAGLPDQPMTVLDAATGRPTMQVRSIAQAALLSVDEAHGCRFGRWKPHPGKAIFGEDHDD